MENLKNKILFAYQNGRNGARLLPFKKEEILFLYGFQDQYKILDNRDGCCHPSYKAIICLDNEDENPQNWEVKIFLKKEDSFFYEEE